MEPILETATGLCPKCSVVRTLSVSIERLPSEAEDGSVRQVEITTRHCATCGTFISRDTRDVSEAQT